MDVDSSSSTKGGGGGVQRQHYNTAAIAVGSSTPRQESVSEKKQTAQEGSCRGLPQTAPFHTGIMSDTR